MDVAASRPRRRFGPALTLVVAVAVAGVALWVGMSLGSSPPPTFQERVQAVAAGLRCPVCQNLSVADSPSELAQQMRADIGSRLRAGQTPQEIRQFFVSRYGTWILLSPPRHGLGILPWATPVAALVAGGLIVASVLRRRSRAGPSAGEPLTASERERIRREVADLEEPD
jgi:cytochrome c-type biogenesis protein CcmH